MSWVDPSPADLHHHFFKIMMFRSEFPAAFFSCMKNLKQTLPMQEKQMDMFTNIFGVTFWQNQFGMIQSVNRCLSQHCSRGSRLEVSKIWGFKKIQCPNVHLRSCKWGQNSTSNMFITLSCGICYRSIKLPRCFQQIELISESDTIRSPWHDSLWK